MANKSKKIVPETKNKKVIKSQLNKNKERLDLMKIQEESRPFVSRFLSSLIREQDEDANAVLDQAEKTPSNASPENDSSKTPDKFTPEGDKEAFNNSMEAETDPSKFDTEGVSPNLTSDTINSIKQWSDKLGEFAEFLNDPSTDSLHKILADGDRAGSLLRGVTRKASDSITRIAGEVEKLKEILNTYIITAPKKLRDTEQQTAGWTQY
jgi:hypothetical protein